MSARGFTTIALASVLTVGGLAAGARSWSIAHARRWSGQNDLGFVTCTHCHLQRIEKMTWAQPRPHHASPAGMAISPDSRKIYVTLDDQNQLVEAETSTLRITRKINLEGGPCALALDTTGERLYVACRDGDRVVVVDAKQFQVIERIEVGAGPVALAFTPTKSGDRLVVANSVSDDISVLALAPLRELSRPQAGREPYAVAVAKDGSSACVANRLAVAPNNLAVPESELTIVDPAPGRVLIRQPLVSSHLAEGTASVPGRNWYLTSLVRVRNLVPITQVANGWVMSSALALLDDQGTVTQLPLDEANDYFADPSGIVVDAEGRHAYIASGGGDTVSVVDLARLAHWKDTADAATLRDAAEDLSLSAEYVVKRIPTGRNPRQLALAPDGRTLFIAERLDDSVLAIRTVDGEPLGRIRLGDGGLTDPIRRGERVFTKASHTFQRQFSCRSCHPDGHVDGLAYDFDGDGIGDNLLDNRTLQGVAGTEPFKWVGKNPSLEVQCGPRFARVLMRTDPIPKDELHDLATFLNSQPPPRWRRQHRKSLTPAQSRGQRIFFATTTSEGKVIPRERRCHTCHRPPLFTNRLLSAIGTQGPRDSTDLFDTPHLLGIAYSAPYLHDGRAKALEELWTVYQTNDLHGVSSYMNKHQLNDLVEYLKTL